MNSPNPALVTERAASRLPRLALLLICAAYLLPGLFGRDPWKHADITAFGYTVSLAKGHGSWLMPTIGGLPADGALLPYWVGAGFIELLGPWIGAPLAARIPFALIDHHVDAIKAVVREEVKDPLNPYGLEISGQLAVIVETFLAAELKDGYAEIAGDAAPRIEIKSRY